MSSFRAALTRRSLASLVAATLFRPAGEGQRSEHQRGMQGEGEKKRWLSSWRLAMLGFVLAGAAMLFGGSAVMALWSERPEAAATEEAAAAPERVEAATNAPPAVAPAAPVASQQQTAAPVEPRLVLAPVPDRERPERRLAAGDAAGPSPRSLASLGTVDPLPAARGEGRPGAGEGRSDAWQRFAVAAPAAEGPMIALVIDDTGHDPHMTERLAALDVGTLTLAFLPYVHGLAEQVAVARAAGHEILLHLPMEPLDGALDTGPQALLTGLSPAALDERIVWNMARLDGYVGINNHMGSRFTADADAMAQLMAALAARGLLFLDSRTTTESVGAEAASDAGVPYLERDVFLDNEPSSVQVLEQLKRTEEVAREQGHAIAIGHAHAWTIDAIAAWAPQARARGFVLVPLTAILRSRTQHIAGTD